MSSDFGQHSAFSNREAVAFTPANAPGTPVVVASPHSGRDYTREFLRETRLSPLGLRASEDAFVDLLASEAPRFGAALITALFPRAYVDVNRARREIDPLLFRFDGRGHGLQRPHNPTPRVRAGLGVIPRLVAQGHPIYRKRLAPQIAEARLRYCYDVYHARLSETLDDVYGQFGTVLLLDCHSMPSIGADQKPIRHDIVLGDRFGASCHPDITAAATRLFQAEGFSVARNAPYAGGYATQAYGTPGRDRHALQIEINRGLYVDETLLEPLPGFADVRQRFSRVLAGLCELKRDWDQAAPLAAE